jgi:hypothetical protein
MKPRIVKTAALPILLSMLAAAGNAVAGKSQTECIKLAMDNGYGGPTCASLFIQTCMDSSSRQEVEKVLSFDMSSIGYGRSEKCGPPGEPGRDRFAKEWNEIKKSNDKW